MGYDIYIGEATPIIEWESRLSRMGVAVVDGQDLGAPPSPSGGWMNAYSDSYIGWDRFAHDVGLHAVFLDKRSGLMRRHPGCEVLTHEHLATLELARERWLQRPERSRIDADGVDWHGRRLDWLLWWTRWALATCQYPSLANR